MNKSGEAVKPLVKSVKAAASLIVVHDELDLPLGRVKISFNKSAGGHNGVKSIAKAVKTDSYIRVRVGISKSTASGKLKKPQGEEEVIDFILGKFKPAEMDELKKVVKVAASAVAKIVTEGKDLAMMEVNQG